MYLYGIMGVVSKLADETVTGLRYAAGVHDQHGIWRQGATTVLSFLASVDKPGYKDLKILPEGYTVTNTIKIFTETALRTASEDNRTSADKITYNDKQYLIKSVKDYSEVDGSYTAIALLVE